MTYDNSRVQWTMTVTVFHGPSFGHAVEVATETKGRPNLCTQDSIGSWRGVGVPERVMEGMEASLLSIFQEHIHRRYGVAPSLEGWWDEPEPF